jgi:hypothetical protein
LAAVRRVVNAFGAVTCNARLVTDEDGRDAV